MGIITQGNLENCIIKGHFSTENYLDQTTLNTLPNVVLIEVECLNNYAPPPSTSTEGYSGFWMVKAENFNIGASPLLTVISPTTIWANGDYGSAWGGSPINDLALDNFLASSASGTDNIATSMQNTNPDYDNINSLLTVGTPVNTSASKGKWYVEQYMASAVDNDGNDISEQSLANWDPRVSDIMICDLVGDVDSATTDDKKKNRVYVFVRLKDDWVYPAEGLTINIDINGFANYVEMANWTVSDRRLKKNIKLIGESLSGLKIYSFEYINKKFGEGFYQGVMSDEIPKHAVVKYEDGYDRVDYSKIDVDFKRVNYG
jgi:hypothetical protein